MLESIAGEGDLWKIC